MSVATNTAPTAASGEKIDGKPSTRPNPVALEAAVTVTGARPSSEGTRDLFTEETRTILVFVDGAVIQLAAGASVGQLLFLTNKKTSEEVVCQILQKRVFRPTVCYVEVQFTEDKPNFWGVSFATEQPGRREFKVAEQVAAQETTQDDLGVSVAPRSEQEVEELKRQVETLRRQLQKLEHRKSQEALAQELAPVNDPVPEMANTATAGAEPVKPEQAAAGGEALLMPASTPTEKKTPRWTVPMALPGRGEAQDGTAPEDLLPQPELDFSRVPEMHGDENDPQSIYKRKRISPDKERLLALCVVLVGALGGAVYARVWTAFPTLKRVTAGVVQSAQQALTGRRSAKAGQIAPANGNAAKSLPDEGLLAVKNVSGNVGRPEQPNGATGTNKAEATPAVASEAAKKPPENRSASTPRPTAENRSEPDATRKGEKSIRRHGPSQTVAPVEAKPVPAVAPDGLLIAPKLIHAAAPVYPPDAMLNYITGDVKAELVVEADGRVGDVNVISGPKALREAAIEALKKYEYAPGTQGGRPTAAKTTATVKFWFNP